jgi:hypothetical protein
MDVKNPLNDEPFKFCGFEPYQRKDGEWTELKVWESKCKTCGKPFTVKTTIGVFKFEDSKSFMVINCLEHRKKSTWQR